MRIDTEANVLETSGLKKTTQFSIANNAVAYQALSDGLYANKIGTIIREVGSNAYDAHVAAGKEDVPFFVHLPTVLEPYLEIKDEGVGLSPDDIEEFYTRYFGSNKRDTNDQTGGFGLGSKSPFLYTKNFTVTSVHHGKKYTYGMYKNDIGEFSCSLITERDSNECNGVSVKVDVQRNDFHDFENEAKNIYRWFPTYPKVNKDLEFKDKPIALQGTDWILYSRDVNNRHHTGSLHVRQGCVAYPVNRKYIDRDNAVLADCDIIITFDIGDLSIVLSRESLSYDDKTIKNLNDKLEKIKTDIHAQITKDTTTASSFMDACKLLAKVYQDNSYSFTRFLKTKDVFWNGQKVKTGLNILCDRLDPQANFANASAVSGGRSHTYDMTCNVYATIINRYQMSHKTLKVNSKPVKDLGIDITRRYLVVINDIPRGLPGRLKAHMEKEGLIATTDGILILHDNDDQFNFKPGIKKLLTYLEIEKKDIIYASALDKLTLKKRVYVKNIEYFQPDGNIEYENNFDVADPAGGYYIPITSNAMDDDLIRKVRATRATAENFIQLLSSLPTPSPITRIYKIPATQRNTKEFKNNKKWINFWEYLDKEMPKLIQKNSKEYYVYMEYKFKLERKHRDRPATLQTSVLRLKTKHNYNKLKNMYTQSTPVLTEVKPIHKSIETLLRIYDNAKYEAFELKDRSLTATKKFEEVYPMLEDLYIPVYGDPSDDTTKKILDYIELVDNYRILTKGKI